MSILDGLDTFHFVVIGFLVAIALIIPPARAVILFLAGLIWEGVKRLAGMIFAAVHEIWIKLLEAHICWLKNWRPRQMVIPTLRRDRTTRRSR